MSGLSPDIYMQYGCCNVKTVIQNRGLNTRSYNIGYIFVILTWKSCLPFKVNTFRIMCTDFKVSGKGH